MRVLIIPSWYPTLARPVSGIFVREQADCLNKTHEVRVLFVDVLPRGVSRAPRHWTTSERGYLEETVEVRNRRFLWQFIYLWHLGRAIKAAYAQFKPDIVHCHVAVPAGWGVVLLRSTIPRPSTFLVLTEHNSNVRSWLGRPGLRWMARKAFYGADLVIAVSEGQRQRIMETFPGTKRIEVVPNVVDTSLFTPTPFSSTEPQYHLLFVGLMDTPQKGVPILLDALAQLHRQDVLRAHLDLVGEGALRASYEARARSLGIASLVTFHGLKSRIEIAALLRKSHLFVLPSLHESQGVVIIEALASGRPVVSTRCGGPEFLVNDSNGIIVAPGQVEPLAGAIVEVLARLSGYDPQRIALDASERFRCDSVAEQLTHVYEDLHQV